MAERGPICVFSPMPMVTVTAELSSDGATDIHFHPGGQGHWVARMIHALGEPVVLCCPIGGESGDVFRALVSREAMTLDAVESSSPTAAYIHDRRSGERVEIAESAFPAADRHELDDLHNSVIARAIDGGICVLAGHPDPGEMWVEHYGRLAGDLRRLGVRTVVDLRGALLDASLAAGITTLKVSAEELGVDGGDALRAVHEAESLASRGADNVVITRETEDTVALYDGSTYVVEPLQLEVVDGRGGGDAAAAALAVALRRDLGAPAALRLAAAASSAAVARRGLGTADPEAVDRLADRVNVRLLDGLAR